MTTAQVVETSVTDSNNSPIQDYVHPDDQTQPTFVSEHLKILGVTLDKKLAFKEHISLQLKKGVTEWEQHWEDHVTFSRSKLSKGFTRHASRGG